MFLKEILICLAIFFTIFFIIYLIRKNNNFGDKLITIQDWNNKNTYTPKFPDVKPMPDIKTAVDKLTASQKIQLQNYLYYLYPALNINIKNDFEKLYRLYNSLTIYYNLESVQPPIDGANYTYGWVAGTDTYNDSPENIKKDVNCDQCFGFYPWVGRREFCEPGWCDKAVKLPIAPLGYFSEYKRLYDELSRKDDTMSIGQTTIPLVPNANSGGGSFGSAASMGQWVVNYVDDDKPLQDEVILQRSIHDINTLKYANSMDMWNPFAGRGVSFLQGGTLHRMYWYPNGAPGQVKDPFRNRTLYPVDAFSLDAPGADYGMLNSNGKLITLDMCMNDIKNLLEYLEMNGTFMNLHWNPPSDEINKRFNKNGSVASGYKLTKTSENAPINAPDYYYTEFSRTDMGSNFFFTGNWFDIFEGAGVFMKYNRTIVGPNKIGMTFKLFYELLNKDEKLCRRIIGADYIKGDNPSQHTPVNYSDTDDFKKGKRYSNQLGVTQGMCMGSSLPGKTGKVILDANDKNSGSWLFWEAWNPNGKEDKVAMLFMGILWLVCNSAAHPPENNTTFVSIFNSANGYSNKTWSFFSMWANTKSYDITKPDQLLKATKLFIMNIIMCSGFSSVENYMLSTWQNSTVFDLYMFALGTYLNYDLIQLTLDISENDMWTRESLSIKLPYTWQKAAQEQIVMEGPHGGSFLVFVGCFGTSYTQLNPIFVGRTDNNNQNPMPYSRSPPPLTGLYNKSTFIYPYGVNNNKCGGPRVSINNGYIISGAKYAPLAGQKFEAVSNFVEDLFIYYADQNYITLRDPMDLTVDPTNPQLKTDVSAYTKYKFDRSLKSTLTENDLIIDPITGFVSATSTIFDKDVPYKRWGERCFGDMCAFYADNTQTKPWGRLATGPGF